MKTVMCFAKTTSMKMIVLIILMGYFLSCSDAYQDDWVRLKTPYNPRLIFIVNDLCQIEGKSYIVSSQSDNVYRIEGDSVRAIWEENSSNKPKFREPNRIKYFDEQFVVCDRANLQLKVFNTSGEYLGSLPKRRLSDSLWRATETGDLMLNDFFLSQQFLGIFHTETREGLAYGTMTVYNKDTKEFRVFEDGFSPYATLAYDQASSTIFIEGHRIVSAYTVTGELIVETGVMVKDGVQFQSINDMACFGGYLYVLDSQGIDDHGTSNSAVIYVLDPSLVPVDTIYFDRAYNVPEAFDFTAGGDSIIVINLDGDAILRIKNPVDKGTHSPIDGSF